MNVNMVSMAMMGREMKEGEVYTVLYHLLTLYLTRQGGQCVERVLCQASAHNVSDLSSLLLRSTR